MQQLRTRRELPPDGRAFYYTSRHGAQRVFVFMPFVVLKLARGRHAAMLRGEAVNARAASRSAFWSDLAIRPLRLGPFAMASHRYAPAGPGDHPAIVELLERRLETAAPLDRTPALALLARNAAYGDLLGATRRRVRAALSRLWLPVTGMHGDCHLYNFCRTRAGGFGLLDWENYTGNASFAYDYIDFHVASSRQPHGQPWVDFVTALEGPAPAAARAARALGVESAALWLYYLLQKIDLTMTRKGGIARRPAAERATYAAIVEAQLETAAGA